jgi:Tol biopolymer transport system component
MDAKGFIKAGVLATFTGSLLATAGWAQLTQRVSVATGGAQATGSAGEDNLSISDDGRYVAFDSDAPNLVAGDTNGARDVFVRDRIAGTTERISVDSNGVQGNADSAFPSISADGRYVAFASTASNLVAGDTNAHSDVFVRDRLSGTTERVSVDSNGVQGNADSYAPSVSADGRYVAFASDATNLVPGDLNGRTDVFVRDRMAGTTERVSVSSTGTEGDSGSDEPSISADGRYVSFDSVATNLVPGDTNMLEDVFVRDRMAGTTERVSLSTTGIQGNSECGQSRITADGRYVVFFSGASNLVPNDTNGAGDIFVRDRQNATTERVSLGAGGVQGDLGSIFSAISSDGRYVSFVSYATNLVPNDTNGVSDVFVRDRMAGTTERVSVSTAGAQGDLASTFAKLSSDGRYVVFTSLATNLVSGDTNGLEDVFVRDRAAAGFASLCDPGADGVIACPCSNPPSGSGRGCDNSSATGGAVLAASGIAYLSMDSLVFTTNSEKPTATSIVMQGNSLIAGGLVFGQGVRCVGGTLKRLYTKTASGGSITAPQAGDPSVSARSAALGDVISAGQSRWYLVYYRDPVVLGGCPASSTFNATQTARIDWSL